ncbi:hypothetical protein EPD83_014285 [Phycicoccus sp. CMS6Z-2]|nr:hypothetical protein [Phycicoccus flavus]
MGVFLVPTVLALAARLPARWVLPVLAAHAVLSEVVQATLIPTRDGDVLDALADLLGVALGALVAGLWARRRSGAPVRRW